MGYEIRQATRKELDTAVAWATEEGWNPGLHDADVFWETDSDGFVVMEKGGAMIGSGSIVSYNGEFGFMGFFIVKPEYRGKGLGTKLWFWRRDKLLSRLKKGAAIGLDGVFNMQAFYAKGGFEFSHRDLRMEGSVAKKNFSDRVTQVALRDFNLINKLDKQCFGFDRTVFLKKWLTMPESTAYKYVSDSGIEGFGVVRKCVRGYKIGPLFAVNYEVAHELFKALASYAAGDVVYLDVPEINPEAMKLAQSYSMKEMFGCARMYYGSAPQLPYDQIFGMTTFELG